MTSPWHVHISALGRLTGRSYGVAITGSTRRLHRSQGRIKSELCKAIFEDVTATAFRRESACLDVGGVGGALAVVRLALV